MNKVNKYWNDLVAIAAYELLLMFINTSRISLSSYRLNMVTLSNGNIFRVAGPVCEEFTGHRWIPLTNASDAELWCFLWSASEQTVVQTTETLGIWDAIALIMTSL